MGHCYENCQLKPQHRYSIKHSIFPLVSLSSSLLYLFGTSACLYLYTTLQVGRISTVAEEALSNIRTVRAFGMEDKECELLKEEAMKAQDLNEQLGWGIGLFQVTFFENCFNLFED